MERIRRELRHPLTVPIPFVDTMKRVSTYLKHLSAEHMTPEQLATFHGSTLDRILSNACVQDVMLQHPAKFGGAVDLGRKALSVLDPQLDTPFSAQARKFVDAFDEESERCVRSVNRLAAKMGRARTRAPWR